MRLLVLLLLATPAFADDEPQRCGHHGCPVEATRWTHPLFWHYGFRGGASIGVMFDFEEDAAGDDNLDGDSARLVLGWQSRGDAFGVPAKLGPLDLLYGVEARLRPGAYAIVPTFEIATPMGGMAPYLGPAVSIGVPLVWRETAATTSFRSPESPPAQHVFEAGLGLYLHNHSMRVLDFRIGVELYPTTDDVARGVFSMAVTL